MVKFAAGREITVFLLNNENFSGACAASDLRVKEVFSWEVCGEGKGPGRGA